MPRIVIGIAIFSQFYVSNGIIIQSGREMRAILLNVIGKRLKEPIYIQVVSKLDRQPLGPDRLPSLKHILLRNSWAATLSFSARGTLEEGIEGNDKHSFQSKRGLSLLLSLGLFNSESL